MGYYLPLAPTLSQCPQWWKNFVNHTTEGHIYIAGNLVNAAIKRAGAKFVYKIEDDFIDEDTLDNPEDTTGILFPSEEDAIVFKLKWV